jgi:hypothetical protein
MDHGVISAFKLFHTSPFRTKNEIISHRDSKVFLHFLTYFYYDFFLSLSLSLSMALQPLWTLAAFFSFVILYTDVTTSWAGDQSVARPLPAHRTSRTQNKRTRTSMHRVGFESTTPVFERTKTVHALDRAATVIGFLVRCVPSKSIAT